MRKKNFYLITLVSLFVCFPLFSNAQEGLFFNLHGSVQGGLKTLSAETDLNGKSYMVNLETTMGWGGGVMMGFGFSENFGLYMNYDFLGQKGSWGETKNVSASTFIFDLGARIPFSTEGNLIPYGLVNGGYYYISFTYGTPTIYIGPGGGYSSGVNSLGGVHGSLGLGLQTSKNWDFQILATRVKLKDTDAVTIIRFNVGYSFWITGLD
ncbi:MAG: outer membrane beta-barrel protein [Ignavibacteriales bacterium]|nr:outer membrane beta-barrel protein [Ignavibacteriales bacterium]